MYPLSRSYRDKDDAYLYGNHKENHVSGTIRADESKGSLLVLHQWLAMAVKCLNPYHGTVQSCSHIVKLVSIPNAMSTCSSKPITVAISLPGYLVKLKANVYHPYSSAA